MSPRTSGQWNEIREAARAKIIRGALEIFKKKGFHAASMESIAKKAKISKGLAYNYFESKEALVAAVIEHWFVELETLWDGIEVIPDPLAKLTHVLDRFCDSVSRDRDLYRLYLSVFLELDYVAAVQKTAGRSDRLTRRINKLRGASRKLFLQLGASDPDAEVAFFRLLTSGLAAEYIMGPRYFPLDAIKTRIRFYYERLASARSSR
ncbi:MAG: TetR/AcrR family transcriptional regulator [Candidatus Acidiferrales bacterium]